MPSYGPDPVPCNSEIFQKGESVAAVDGSSNAVEQWVCLVVKEAGARMDWHYSGGIANILHLGDAESRARVEAAIDKLASALNGRIMRRFKVGEPGLYRKGVTPVPEGTIAGFYEGGDSSTFIVDNK